MSKRLFTSQAQTWTAQATAATLTNATYMGMLGGSTTQVVDILEVMISGMATSSAVAAFNLARASTIAVTPTALAAPNSDGFMMPTSTALVAGDSAISFVAAGTGPQASAGATDAKLSLSMNAFGGIVRWNAAPTQQWTIVGETGTAGETLLWNSSTGGGANAAANAHILYEPY